MNKISAHYRATIRHICEQVRSCAVQCGTVCVESCFLGGVDLCWSFHYTTPSFHFCSSVWNANCTVQYNNTVHHTIFILYNYCMKSLYALTHRNPIRPLANIPQPRMQLLTKKQWFYSDLPSSVTVLYCTVLIQASDPGRFTDLLLTSSITTPSHQQSHRSTTSLNSQLSTSTSTSTSTSSTHYLHQLLTTMHTTILATTLLTVACALSVPFDPAFINSTHEVRAKPCSYPRSDTSSLTLNAKSLTYMPTINNDNRGPEYNGATPCQGRVDLYYRHRPNHMWIEVIPSASRPFLRDASGRPAVDQGPSCDQLQKKQVYWPWGASRPGFVAEFKKIYQAAVSMKSSGPECVAKTGHLDAVIAYMHAVAFDYFIPLTA